LVNLPSRSSLRYSWNFGRILGILLVFQILTGTVLVFYYTPERSMSFDSVQYIMLESNLGWILRIFHFNGARMFFIFIFLHLFKGLFFFSYRLKFVWSTGLLIFLLLIIEAFMGYVLVWAQISFWAAVVITSLLSVIPVFGSILVSWVWGGFRVSSATLKFFFVLHFLLPWFLLVLVGLHLLFLHSTGRTSKIFINGDFDKINFFVFYWSKDGVNFFFEYYFFYFVLLSLFYWGTLKYFW